MKKFFTNNRFKEIRILFPNIFSATFSPEFLQKYILSNRRPVVGSILIQSWSSAILRLYVFFVKDFIFSLDWYHPFHPPPPRCVSIVLPRSYWCRAHLLAAINIESQILGFWTLLNYFGRAWRRLRYSRTIFSKNAFLFSR